MRRHPSWPDAGADRQVAAAEQPSGGTAPSAAAPRPAAAASPAARSSHPRVTHTELEQAVMSELNISDLSNVALYKTKSGGTCWRVRLGAEGVRSAHGELR
jgi:hypothetical protein